MIYDCLANALLEEHCRNIDSNFALNNATYIFANIKPWGDFGFTAMMNYSGLMAQPSRTGRNKGIVKRAKQGLFDIFINTGTFFDNSGLTHRNILEYVTEFSTLDNCFSVWRGENPAEIARNESECAILTSVMLAFFEQEVNWGNEEGQRYTYFAPKVTMPNRIRPRDMLMGYIFQAFILGVDKIAFWQNSRPTTTTFISPDGSNYGYEDYPPQFKRFFSELENDEYASALMVSDARKAFRSISNGYLNNPFYQG